MPPARPTHTFNRKRPGLLLGGATGEGGSGSRFASIPAIVKENSAASPYCIPNEHICQRVAQALCLPVAAGTILGREWGRAPSYASLDFNHQLSSLPPVDTDECVSRLPGLSTGLLLFDILVANCDRHRKNFAVDFLRDPPAMHIFDHDLALFGYQEGAGSDRLTALRDALGISGGAYSRDGNRHCLLDKLTTDSHFAVWLERIRALPDYLLDAACEGAVGHGVVVEEARAASAFLKHRRDHLEGILKAHRDQFRAILTWRLVP